MPITTDNTNQQPKKDYHTPTLTNQGKLDEKTLTMGTPAAPGDATGSS